MACTQINHIIREDVFSPNVLVGNWYENRLSSKTDRKAVAPGIYGNSDCSNFPSVYENDFRVNELLKRDEFVIDYLRWKQDAYHNRITDNSTNIQFSDGKQFERNMTTMMDVMYRIRRNEAVPTAAEGILRKKPKEDFLMSYGNATSSGLRKYKWCESWLEHHRPIDRTVYQETFVPKQAVGPIERRPRAPRVKF